MFSTKLVENRYYVPCIVMTGFPIVHSFIVDTGAKYTCCSFKNIDPTLKEDSFSGAEIKTLGGMVAGTDLIFYRYHTKQFTIGNINMGERDIWITFDDMATDDVLGMDILQDINYFGNAKTKQLEFRTDDEVR